MTAIVLACDKVFDGVSAELKGPLEILVEDGRIAAIGTAVERPPGASLIDLSDRTVSPGFIDTHVHLTMDASNLAVQTTACRLHGRVKRTCRSRPCRTIKREGAKNLYGSTWIPETEWRGQSREVANDFCIVGAVQLVEAVAGHVDCALLKHDLSGRRDFENAIAKICAQVGILVMDAQRRETVRAWMPSRSRGFS